MKTLIVVICLTGAAVGWLATHLQPAAGIVIVPQRGLGEAPANR